MYVKYAEKFQSCSYAIISSPRAHTLMSFLDNLQMHTHFYLLEQRLKEPVFSLFLHKAVSPEEKVVVIHQITTGSLKTWDNAGLNHSMVISRSTGEIWGLTSQLCNSFVNSNYTASTSSKEVRAEEMAVMKLHYRSSSFLTHAVDCWHKRSLAKI